MAVPDCKRCNRSKHVLRYPVGMGQTINTTIALIVLGVGLLMPSNSPIGWIMLLVSVTWLAALGVIHMKHLSRFAIVWRTPQGFHEHCRSLKPYGADLYELINASVPEYVYVHSLSRGTYDGKVLKVNVRLEDQSDGSQVPKYFENSPWKLKVVDGKIRAACAIDHGPGLSFTSLYALDFAVTQHPKGFDWPDIYEDARHIVKELLAALAYIEVTCRASKGAMSSNYARQVRERTEEGLRVMLRTSPHVRDQLLRGIDGAIFDLEPDPRARVEILRALFGEEGQALAEDSATAS